MRTIERLGIALSALAAAATAYAAETITYSYDARGRLVKVVHNGSVNNNVQAEYKYDQADNRIRARVEGGPAQCLVGAPLAAPVPIPRCRP